MCRIFYGLSIPVWMHQTVERKIWLNLNKLKRQSGWRKRWHTKTDASGWACTRKSLGVCAEISFVDCPYVEQYLRLFFKLCKKLKLTMIDGGGIVETIIIVAFHGFYLNQFNSSFLLKQCFKCYFSIKILEHIKQASTSFIKSNQKEYF